MRIMIVDDNALMRKEIISAVSNNEDVIMECADGESAISNFKEFNPDWILLDIRMNKINGIDAARVIREQAPGIKLAIVTSYDNPIYRKLAKLHGVEYYFLKSNMLSIREIIEVDKKNKTHNKSKEINK
ncbi:MAG: response regulator transcription factor [Melioribacteraceae bacterium]|nr:response regulator transcription factor [Melioribacteraceae bacterium]MCF8354247.1 response regulator transcription factor [Melioribacteraceae bacterium]MCF8394811.1 response regulator transcription factor [Melioribacteraceae bacterium]MCF8417978.1 response regulator transcription factor [Melioribacteraceae bacterium]